MATKGGSLLGRADSMLVQGALKAELANVSPSMKGVYDMQVENVGNLQTAIQDIFYATNKSNNDLYNEIKEKSGLILADIESGTFSDDGSIDLYTNAINDLREQAKSIPRGKQGEAQRAKIRAQLAKMKTDSANGEGVITEIASLINNDQISQYAVNEGDLKLFNDILDGSAKREIVNGELVYSTVDADNNPIKINHNELNKRFIKKDYTVEAGALKLSGGFSKIGLQGTPYDFSEALNSYEGLMTTRDGFMHLINKPFGTMKISFAQALQGGDSKLVGEMMGALNSIGGVDIDGDGNPDQITQQNYKKLADILINPDAANFSVAKRAAAAFYADNDGRAQHKKGLDIFNAKQRKQEQSKQTTKTDKFGGFSQYSDTGGDPDANVNSFQSIPYSDKVTRRKSLKNFETVPGAHYTYKYDKNKEGGWAAYNGTEFVRNMNGGDVARIEGLMSASDSSFSVFNQEKVQSDLDKKQLEPKTPGVVGLGMLKFEGFTYGGNIKDIEKKLHDVFDDTFKQNFTVSSAGEEAVSGGAGNYFRPIQNKMKITSKDGKFEKIYNIGSDATQDVVDQINKDFANYMTIDNSYQE